MKNHLSGKKIINTDRLWQAFGSFRATCLDFVQRKKNKPSVHYIVVGLFFSSYSSHNFKQLYYKWPLEFFKDLLFNSDVWKSGIINTVFIGMIFTVDFVPDFLFLFQF